MQCKKGNTCCKNTPTLNSTMCNHSLWVSWPPVELVGYLVAFGLVAALYRSSPIHREMDRYLAVLPHWPPSKSRTAADVLKATSFPQSCYHTLRLYDICMLLSSDAWGAFCHEQHNILHHRTGNVAWSQSNFFFSDVKHWGCTCFITSGFLPFFQHTVKMTFWTVRTYTIWMAWDIPFWNLLWQAVATQTTGISNGSYTFWFNQFTTSTAKEAFHVWYLTCNVVYPEVRNHLKLASSMQALLFLEPQNTDKTINAIVH